MTNVSGETTSMCVRRRRCRSARSLMPSAPKLVPGSLIICSAFNSKIAIGDALQIKLLCLHSRGGGSLLLAAQAFAGQETTKVL